jgi:hypothetical protein
LLANAVCQSIHQRLIDRIREQARSHIFCSAFTQVTLWRTLNCGWSQVL